MNTKIIKLNDYEIEVFDSETQAMDTIVFAHGLASNLRQFKKQIEYLKNDYRVVSYSLQGHGRSEHPDDEKDYTIESYYKTIKDLFSELNIKDCIWVGNSMGGVLGYEVLRQQPDKIKLMITNGTTPELITGKGTLNTIYTMDKFLIKKMGFDGYVRFAAKNSTRRKDLVEDIYSYMIESSPETVIFSHQILGNYSYINEMKSSQCPIVIIRALYDKGINKSLKKSMKNINYKKNIEIVTLPNAGHISNIERPKEYTEIIINSINKYINYKN